MERGEAIGLSLTGVPYKRGVFTAIGWGRRLGTTGWRDRRGATKFSSVDLRDLACLLVGARA